MRVLVLLTSLLTAWIGWAPGNGLDLRETGDPVVDEPLGRSLDSPFLPPIGR